MTHNLLHKSRTKPKLSAYATIFGINNFNRCHLEPPSTKAIVHKKTLKTTGPVLPMARMAGIPDHQCSIINV